MPAAGGDPREMRSEAEGVSPRAQDEVDDLVVRLKGHIHMKKTLERSGAPDAVIEEQAAEIDRLRSRLVDLVREVSDGYGTAA